MSVYFCRCFRCDHRFRAVVRTPVVPCPQCGGNAEPTGWAPGDVEEPGGPPIEPACVGVGRLFTIDHEEPGGGRRVVRVIEVVRHEGGVISTLKVMSGQNPYLFCWTAFRDTYRARRVETALRPEAGA